MKKAKVNTGTIQHVWPWTKTFPDGRTLVKQLPPQYQGLNGKPVPDCIIDVPDDVQVGWRWNGKAYARPNKVFVKRRDPLTEVMAEQLGISYDAMVAKIKAKKRAAKGD